MSEPPLNGLLPEDLLPHRDGMLLLSEVLRVDDSSARARFRVGNGWPLAGERGVDALVLIELAAQTAGVCNGWERVRTRGRESSAMGWLVGIKQADIGIDLLPFGSDVIAEAVNTHVYGNLREVSCRLLTDGREVARITLQVYQAEE